MCDGTRSAFVRLRWRWLWRSSADALTGDGHHAEFRRMIGAAWGALFPIPWLPRWQYSRDVPMLTATELLNCDSVLCQN